MQTTNSQGRNVVLVCAAIVLGALAAALFYRNTHLQANGISEQAAKRAGFSSAAEFNELSTMDKKMIDDDSGPVGWDEEDFAYFQRSLSAGNEKMATTTIMKLGWLSKPDQRRRALAIVDGRKIPAEEKVCWLYVFRQWFQNPVDPGIKSAVLSSANPDIAAAAKEVADESDQKNTQRT